jgi:hypothetical protein
MRGFKSAAHAQRFLAVHGVVQNLFRVGRHLLRSAHHRLLRRRAFEVWNAATCACRTGAGVQLQGRRMRYFFKLTESPTFSTISRYEATGQESSVGSLSRDEDPRPRI